MIGIYIIGIFAVLLYASDLVYFIYTKKKYPEEIKNWKRAYAYSLIDMSILLVLIFIILDYLCDAFSLLGVM